MKKQFLILFRKPRAWISLYLITFALLFIPLIFLSYITLALSLFIFSGILFFIPTLIPNDSLFGPMVTHFTTRQKEVWLTLDDGPDPQDTPKILHLLDQYHAKATFFVIGNKAKKYPELIQAILQRGHSIGNHTQTHPVSSFWIAFPTRLRQEIHQCQETLTQIPGVPVPPLFRAPVGMANFFLHPILKKEGLDLIGWSARGFDTLSNHPEKIVNRIWKKVRPGSIILLHEGILPPLHHPPICPQILEILLRRLTQEKYRCIIPPIK